MTERSYINAAQQRVLRLLPILAGHEFDGLSPTDIAKALKTSASNVTRDLANLQHAGLVEQIEPSMRWRLTARMGQIALAVMTAYDKARERVDEIGKRYATPHR